MSKATDLLASLSADEIDAYSAGTGSEEPHIVIGRDRIVRVPDELKRLGVERDHNIETVTFDCPRYWDGLDMSKMQIYVNYVLSSGYKDSYPVDNVTVDNDIMHFSWTISANVTQKKGTVIFLVCIKKTDENDIEVNHWNSELCKDCYISEGMETEEGVPMEYSDLYSQLLERMASVEQINIEAAVMEQLLNDTRSAASAAEEAKEIALDESDYIKNSYAPAIKGTVSGPIVRVDDVSPIEHAVKASVYSKNLIPYPYYDSTVTQNGVTFTMQEDGGIHVSGTPTQNTSINLVMQYTKKLLVTAGKTYTLTCWSTLTSATGYVYFQNWTNGVSNNNYSVRQGGIAIPITDDGSAQIGIVLLKGQTFDETMYVQFEEGLVSTEYVPYVDPSTITVKRTGKNLACASYGYNVTQHGLTFKATKGSSEVLIDGTSTQEHSYAIMKGIILPPGRYTASLIGANIVDSASDRIYIHDPVKGTVIQNYIMSNKPQTFTITENTSVNIEMVFGANGTYSNKVVKIQIEQGESATAYEPHKVDVYTPDTAGEISGIVSFSPTMTLCTDTDGAIVELEYNRDTTKAISGGRVNFKNGDTITLADNITYYATEAINTLNVIYPKCNFISSVEFTLADSGDITIALPTSKYIGGAPEFANGETWELNIKNGVVVGGKVE